MNTSKIRYSKVRGFPRYLVGSDGSIWSKTRPTEDRPSGWRRLKLRWAGEGYLFVELHHKGIRVPRYVHRLVLECFVGPCPEGHQAAHGDGDKTNNDLGNLRWATPKDNHADKLRHGTHQGGERNPSAKLDEKKVQVIRLMLNDGFGQRYLARRFGVNQSTISSIRRRNLWPHVADWHPFLPAAEVGAA